jgi:hypothetical protein
VTETWADDFETIRARMEELRRERRGAQAAESDLQQDAPTHRAQTASCSTTRFVARTSCTTPIGWLAPMRAPPVWTR